MNKQFEQQFKKGSLEMVLLSIISSGETYGYEIITKLNNQSNSTLGYSREGTIYPILYRLEKDGFIESKKVPSLKNGGMKKYYYITNKGIELLDEMVSFWDDYVDYVNHFTKKIKKGDFSNE